MLIDHEFKSRLIFHCIDLQNDAVKFALNAMKDAQEEANNYGAPKDRYDGFRNQQLRRKNLYAKQLEQAALNLETLQRIEREKTYHKAEFGALIVTETRIFFIAIGLGFVLFEGHDLAIISVMVPAFQAIKNKIPGEGFSLNGVEYTIQQII